MTIAAQGYGEDRIVAAPDYMVVLQEFLGHRHQYRYFGNATAKTDWMIAAKPNKASDLSSGRPNWILISHRAVLNAA